MDESFTLSVDEAEEILGKLDSDSIMNAGFIIHDSNNFHAAPEN